MKKFKLGVVLLTVACLLLSSIGAFGSIALENETNNENWADFSSIEIDVVANTVTVKGLCASAHETNITVWIYEETTNKDLIFRQFVSESDGSFNMKFVLNTAWYDAENVATIKVAAENTDTYSYTGIALYSIDELQACVDGFTSITDAESFKAFLSDNLEMLGRDDAFTEDELEGLYEVYSDGDYDVDDTEGVLAAITDIINIYAKRVSLLDEMNTAAEQGDGNQIKQLLTSKYADIVAFEIDNSKLLIEADMWQRMTGQTYASIADIEEAYFAAYDAQLESDRETGAVAVEKELKFDEASWSLDVKSNVVVLSGKLAVAGAKNITVKVSPVGDEESIILVQQFKSIAKTGAFEITMPLNSGRFNGATEALMKVTAPNADIWNFYVPIFAQERIDAMIEEFKSISSKDDLEAFLTNEEYKAMLKNGVFDAEELKVLFEIFEERADSYEDFTKGVEVSAAITELEQTMYDVFEFINDLNDAIDEKRWGNIRATIETDYAHLAEKINAYDELLDIAKNKGVKSDKGVYERLFGMEFGTIAEVVDALKDACKDQKAFEALEKPQNTRPAGGGGGGGGNVIIGSTDKADTNESTADDTNTGLDLPANVDPEKLPVGPFTDISSTYSWAADAIDGLRIKGIIRGDGNGTYRPGSTITREEFLSILLNAYGVDVKNGTTTFSDVDANAWYNDVIYTGVNLGIINGVGNNMFGTGQNISRIDMVVMAARAAETLGIKFPQIEKAVIFEDYTEIPEYGYNYVVMFQQADFINGDDTGNFNALNDLTRAEAAVLFWNIVSYLD